MKTVQKMFFAIALVIVLAACQSSTASNNGLSNPNTRKEIMDTIANDTAMCKEMMGAMMNNKNGKMAMMEHGKMMMMEDHDGMMKMMGNNPEMMKNMMGNMMEACKKDTAMMMAMCKKMMDEPKMMDMMQKMKGGKMDMDKMDMNKMDSKDKMKGMDHKMPH